MSARNLAKVAGSINDDGSLKDNGLIDLSHTVNTFDSYGSLPRVGILPGQQALTEDTNTLFITDGNVWFRTAIVNQTPQITSILNDSGLSSPFTLTPNVNTNITITVNDDGPVLYTYTTTDSATDLSVIANDSDGTFTFTPQSLSNILAAGYDSNGGQFSVTFKASDGVSFGLDSATFSVSYYVYTPLDWTSSTKTDLFPNTSMGGWSSSEQFGFSIDFTPNGEHMIVAAPYWSSTVGSVQYFNVDSNGLTTYNTYTSGSDFYNSGSSCALISPTHVAIGGPGRSNGTGGYVSIRTTTNNWQSVSASTNLFVENNQTRFGQGMTWDHTSNVLAVWGTDGHIGKIEFMYSTNFITWTRVLGYTTLNTNYTSVSTMTTSSDKGVSLDRGRAAIGLPYYDFTSVNGSGTNITNCGGVDLVDRNGSTGANYNQNAKFISSPNPQNSGRFGHDVQLLDDILIVSQVSDSAEGYINQGSVYCYSTNDSGDTWTLNQRIRELNDIDLNARYFGENLNLTKTADGNEYLLAVAASSKDPGGAVYIYGSTDKTTWTKKVKLEPSNNDFSYGDYGLKWNNNGTMLAVGQRTADSAGTNYGKVDIFTI